MAHKHLHRTGLDHFCDLLPVFSAQLPCFFLNTNARFCFQVFAFVIHSAWHALGPDVYVTHLFTRLNSLLKVTLSKRPLWPNLSQIELPSLPAPSSYFNFIDNSQHSLVSLYSRLFIISPFHRESFMRAGTCPHLLTTVCWHCKHSTQQTMNICWINA